MANATVTFADMESEAVELRGKDEKAEDEGQQEVYAPMPHHFNQNITVPVAKKPKNRKSMKARGPGALPKDRGTGFEEYFADPPMTPVEALEEKEEIYSQDLTFIERMQNCITRFRARRRLQADRITYFNEYLFLGGVDSSPLTGTGLADHDFSDFTAAEKCDAFANDIIYGTSAAGDRFYNGDKEAWTVDFAGVVAGFLSITLPQITGGEWDKMAKGLGIVENFLKYVIHHDVCPEYEQAVKNALKVCDLAKIEWPMLHSIVQVLPGQFNLAATELFCVEDPNETWSIQQFGLPKGLDARSIFYSSFALLEKSDDMWKKIMKQTPKLVREFDCTLKLLSLKQPSKEVCERFKTLSVDNKNANLVPIGRATFAHSDIEDEWDTPVLPCPFKTDTIDLYFDDVVLDNLTPGMKMKLTVGELDIGLFFVKSIDIVVPSFHTFLPQELMRHYKTPRDNERPAPSVQDPDAEEKQHAKEAKEG